MRTTVRLSPSVLKQAKLFAGSHHMTLTALIEESLRERIAHRDSPTKACPVKLPTFRGNGVLAGVDIDDTAALLDVMESR